MAEQSESKVIECLAHMIALPGITVEAPGRTRRHHRRPGQVTIPKRVPGRLGQHAGHESRLRSLETADQVTFDAVSRRARGCRELRRTVNSVFIDAAAARAAMNATSASSACWMCAARSLHAAVTSPVRHGPTNVMCSFSARMRPRLVRDN